MNERMRGKYNQQTMNERMREKCKTEIQNNLEANSSFSPWPRRRIRLYPLSSHRQVIFA
jgi:hypothetical protein